MSSGDFVQSIADGEQDTLPVRPMTLPVTIGRWVAVIPAGLIAAFLVMFPVHWLIMVASSGDNLVVGLLSAEVTELLVISFTSPFFIIYAGAWVAPVHKVEAGVALAIAIALLFGGAYVLVFTGGIPQMGGWYSLNYGATPALNSLGIFLALYTVRSNMASVS